MRTQRDIWLRKAVRTQNRNSTWCRPCCQRVISRRRPVLSSISTTAPSFTMYCLPHLNSSYAWAVQAVHQYNSALDLMFPSALRWSTAPFDTGAAAGKPRRQATSECVHDTEPTRQPRQHSHTHNTHKVPHTTCKRASKPCKLATHTCSEVLARRPQQAGSSYKSVMQGGSPRASAPVNLTPSATARMHAQARDGQTST